MEGNTPEVLCVTPQRKRTWVPASVTNLYSTKRRRVSFAPADLGKEVKPSPAQSIIHSEEQADRFISARPHVTLPLNITPRTQRIARGFGLIDDKLLRYSAPGASSSHQPVSDQLRVSFSTLLQKAAKVSPTSAAGNLGKRKQFTLALDGPGIPSDPFAYPLTWSKKNVIAVACGKDVYYQDLSDRRIVHLCKIDKVCNGKTTSVEWSPTSPSIIALGTTTGSVQLWDAEMKSCIRTWRDLDWDPVGGLNWHQSQDLLTVGADNGMVRFYDVRQPDAVATLTRHKSKVHGVRWNYDGNYLATSDQQGVVYIWDARASKTLDNDRMMGGRVRHGAPVKALAWCPWQSDLLATGSTYPDGKLRIFSVKSTNPIPMPRHTIPLHTAVTSIHWSPHCKEIATTHGTSWNPNAPTTGRMVSCPSQLSNSLTVHTYPSFRRVVSVQAHAGAVGHSCLSPDGTDIFTICPAEEAMKMWHVWSTAKEKKRESAFDKFSIR
ncbi:hypothetical protein PHLCEN_2v6253 [Hermanssonia centrifuga]|uniref:CDC20/Fizzy WD40 domain-containing protein n=1 Tax=Hermanssonia centrifuga TaxID=98765 RepID=A0A2R6NZZ6_9APHY|nr:hypothetical protein PHLCEN_2v6253 [Hermanssonia centrifuga]